MLIDWRGAEPTSLAAAAERLHAAVAAALPGSSASAQLKRTALNWLLERGLQQRSDGRYELRAVTAANVGHGMATAACANAALRAIYKTPGHTLADLLNSLQSAGLASIGFVGLDKYAVALPQRLLQTAGAAPLAMPAATPAQAAAAAAILPPVGIDVAAYPLLAQRRNLAAVRYGLTTAALKTFEGAPGGSCLSAI